MSQRDPFPYPRLENDCSFSGFKQQQRGPYDKPTHLVQSEEPWSRLHDRATSASTRRSVMHYDREAPRDSLDFCLKSVYNHHEEFLQTKSQTLYQRETVSAGHRRTPKSCNKQEAPQNELERDIRMWVSPQRCSIYSIEGAIESHHNASTNRGYSRKHDGSFFSK
ncbi:cilia- and flagella-associated protein 276 [Myripristis murdjan]|uniref:cilia- and flagella-associated protein 276 n=1 Tax=Myripristis murdjan TaxID=586833 RepID=UPI001175F1E3|nr:uncharacterized protein C1orf194 homolog [Myripristis murdjan]